MTSKYKFNNREKILKRFSKLQIFLALVLFFVHSIIPLISQEKKEDVTIKDSEENDKTTKFTEVGIQVIGSKDTDRNKIPGSAYTISKDYLEKASPTDPMEALRRAPGASIRYQDAAGLTPNIGFRGVSNEESRKTLILEDGVLTSLSPYGQPESYYVPSIERMERVEVIKGSGSILFGPNTIGGIVNFVTKKPPIERKLVSKTIGGENSYFSQYLSLGESLGKSAYDINLFRKQGDGFRDYQNFWVNELNLKWYYYWSEKHKTIIKYSFHEQNSQSSYLGLSQGLFWKNPKINPAKYDVKELDRNAFILTHEWKVSSDRKLIAIAYGTRAKRDWARQEFFFDSKRVQGPYGFINEFAGPPSDFLGIYSPGLIGNRPGDTIYMREPYIARDQLFRTGGLELKLDSQYEILGIKNEVNSGVRFHGENNLIATSFQYTDDLGGYITSSVIREEPISTGIESYAKSKLPSFLINRQERKVRSFAAYLQDRIHITNRLKVIPGVRYEEFIQSLITTRRPATSFDTQLGLVLPGDTSVNRRTASESRNKVILPGLGISYDLIDKFVWFAGAHKGFSPPTFGTSFSNLGEDFRLLPETSTNYETGVRGDLFPYLYLELVGYRMFFRDQIVNVREISDGRGSRPENTGFSTHTGGELVTVFDFGKYLVADWRLPLEIIYSYINAKNLSYQFIQYTEDELQRIQIIERPLYQLNNYQLIPSNTSGNRLPYVPEHTLTVALGFESKAGYYGRVEYQFIDKQFTDLENTKDESPDGSVGVIPKIGLWNGSLGYKSTGGWTLFVNGKNLQDRRYVSGRLPIGIHPGPFRQINLGINIEL